MTEGDGRATEDGDGSVGPADTTGTRDGCCCCCLSDVLTSLTNAPVDDCYHIKHTDRILARNRIGIFNTAQFSNVIHLFSTRSLSKITRHSSLFRTQNFLNRKINTHGGIRYHADVHKYSKLRISDKNHNWIETFFGDNSDCTKSLMRYLISELSRPATLR